MAASASRRFSAPAVIIGLDCITGLQSARILADRGVPVIGIAADRQHFCARTRVCHRVIGAPTSGDGLIDALERLAARRPGPMVLLPCTDAAVLTLSAARDRLPTALRVVLPPHDVIEMLMDKTRFVERATVEGWAIPTTRVLRSRSDAEQAAADLPFPAVLKPSLKTPRWLAATKAKAYRLADGAELLDRYDETSGWADLLLAQEWIDGGEDQLISFNGYFDRDGIAQATFMARKIRQWPPETGTSCLGEEIRDDEVLAAALSLFGSVGYRGLAYLEVKRNPTTGRFGIVEPNVGRPTGRSAIAERGGVELILTAYCDALQLPLPERRTQHYTGVKWIYLRHDLQASARAWRRGDLGVRTWWRSVRGPKIEAVLSARDPLPAAAEMITLLSRLTTSVRGRRERPRP